MPRTATPRPRMSRLRANLRGQMYAKHGRFIFLPYVPAEVLRDVRRDYFPRLADRYVSIRFEEGDAPLAHIWSGFSRAAWIAVHDSLNRPDTPLEVFMCVLKHELLHLEVPSRNGDSHPPEFWERESKLCPEKPECVRWLDANIPALREVGPGRRMLVLPERIDRAVRRRR